MLRPDEIAAIKIQVDREFTRWGLSLEAIERLIKCINLAGYKLVKSDDSN